MKVWLVQICESYGDSNWIFGIYATKELAEKEWASFLAEAKAEYDPDEFCYLDTQHAIITEYTLRQE